MSGKSLLKGRLFQEAKDRSTGDNALGVGLFLFSFLASNQVWSIPLSRLLMGAGRVMGTAPAFRNTQLEELERLLLSPLVPSWLPGGWLSLHLETRHERIVLLL